MRHLTFNCRLTYYTPAGHKQTTHFKTYAQSADLAVEVAEKLLRCDKRRRVGTIAFFEAFQV